MDKTIRTRIAPSPTGFAHVGTAYVMLLNYAFTRKNGGSIILRLDDTDQKRHVQGAEDAIYLGLTWLGFDWDEGPDKGGEYGPYRASEKLEYYRVKAKELLDKGLAYEDKGAIRFKNQGIDQTWKDLIHQDITFPGGEVTDFVIIKSDGFPTYNFNTVIDDIDMNITHVIRGEEHISNTPRQLALYQAFGAVPPEFAHFPTLRNADRKKLSKRRDSVDLRIFRAEGYLPEALVNFLGLMGWSHPEGKDIFTLKEFVDVFDIKRVRKAGPIFDVKKLDWINGIYIRNTPDETFVHLLNQHIAHDTDIEFLKQVAPLIKERISKLSDAEPLLTFFWEEPKISREIFEDLRANIFITPALNTLSSIKVWNLENVNSSLTNLISEKEFKVGEFYMHMRLAIAGKKITPPINESMIILGQDVVLRRLENAQRELLEIENTEKD